jgi:hypothetical protein
MVLSALVGIHLYLKNNSNIELSSKFDQISQDNSDLKKDLHELKARINDASVISALQKTTSKKLF